MKDAVLTMAAACLIAAPMSLTYGQKTNASEKSAATESRTSVESRVDQRVDYLTKVLSLTNAQQAQARKIFINTDNANTAVFDNLQVEQIDLHTAINSDQPSSTITEFSGAIGGDVGKLVANQASASERLHNILNPEQQTKFSHLQRETYGWLMGIGLISG
jgi:Spy/CpxP family protein refolding chaperone